MELRAGRASDAEKGDFLTKAEAATRIVAEMDAVTALAKRGRNRAHRILRAERKAGEP